MSSKWEYFTPFYIFNIILIFLYPFIRNYGNTFMLNYKDSWGFKRENSVLTFILTILTIRFLRYFTNWKKYIHEVFFYCKSGIAILTLIIDYKLSLWYMFLCIIVWLLFKPPRYNGPSNIVYIQNEQLFNQIVMTDKNINVRQTKHKENIQNIWFCIFYSNYSDDCLYTEEIFAKLSLKYLTKSLNFAKIDVDLNENLCKKLKINITGMKISLPYIILFVNGEEKERFPGTDNKGNLLRAKFYREKELVKIFELDDIYEKTK